MAKNNRDSFFWKTIAVGTLFFVICLAGGINAVRLQKEKTTTIIVPSE
jgi:hypothetical protein